MFNTDIVFSTYFIITQQFTRSLEYIRNARIELLLATVSSQFFIVQAFKYAFSRIMDKLIKVNGIFVYLDTFFLLFFGQRIYLLPKVMCINFIFVENWILHISINERFIKIPNDSYDILHNI